MAQDRKEYMRAWYQAHKEEMNAYRRADVNSFGKTKK